MGDGGTSLAGRVPALLYARARDAAWTLHDVSAGGADVLRRPPSELGLGSSLLAAVHPDDRGLAVAQVEAALLGASSFAVQYRLAVPGADVWVLDRGRLEGAAVLGVVVELDAAATAEAARRAELVQRGHETDKLEAIARLAGGIAHEFNNVLTGILGHAALLRSHLVADGGAAHAVHAAHTIEQASRRAALLTQQLLGFARKGKVQDVVFDLATVVDDALAARDMDAARDVRLVRPPPDAVAVRGDPTQVQQVVLHLVQNAREALAGRGGTITVAVRWVELDAGAVAHVPGVSPGSYAALSVEDDGPGVAAAVRPRLFEPFFSTKARHNGMGLAMAYGIVRNHGGFLALDGDGRAGARFVAYLPVEKAERPSVSSEFTVVEPSSSARVLFVDDEEFVRYAARAQLEALGHQVTLARDGEEALALFRLHQAELDVVVLDLTMPRMDGAACFRALKALAPDVRVVLSTGFGRDGAVEALLEQGAAGVLEKPYRQAQLAQAIAQARAAR